MTNILTVDDSRVCLKMIDRVLSRAGHAVVCTQNPNEVTDLVKTYPFDMVLIDIVMPQKDGWQLLSELRALPQTHRLPIMMLSGIADAATRTRGIRAGADDFIVKPFDPEEMLARVEGLLARYRHPLGHLSGTFDAASFSQFLINVAENKATGTLHVLTDHTAGQLFIDRGHLVGAHFGERQGLAALETILDMPNGLHQFIPSEQLPEHVKTMRCALATAMVSYRDLVKQHQSVQQSLPDHCATLLAKSCSPCFPHNKTGQATRLIHNHLLTCGGATLTKLKALASFSSRRIELAVAWLCKHQAIQVENCPKALSLSLDREPKLRPTPLETAGKNLANFHYPLATMARFADTSHI